MQTSLKCYCEKCIPLSIFEPKEKPKSIFITEINICVFYEILKMSYFFVKPDDYTKILSIFLEFFREMRESDHFLALEINKILNKYIPVNIINETKYQMNFLHCLKCETRDSLDRLDSKTMICKICETIITQKYSYGTPILSMTEKGKSKKSASQDEMKLENFTKRLSFFEGDLSKSPINSLVFTQLEDYFKKKGINCDQIREDKKYDSIGRKENTSITMLVDAMTSTNNKFFDRIEYVGHILFGWKLIELGEDRNLIIEDYCKTQKIYLEKKKRSATLNVNLRLLFHLRAKGYPYKLKDFKTIGNISSLKHHDDMFFCFSSMTGLKYTSILKDE